MLLNSWTETRENICDRRNKVASDWTDNQKICACARKRVKAEENLRLRSRHLTNAVSDGIHLPQKL
jgi:hypothetical protein